MNRTAITLATTLALLVTLPAAGQAKKKPVPRAVPAQAPLVLAPAASEQLAAAGLTFFGDYACALGKTLRVSLNPKFDGYVDLLFDKQLFTLKPVLSYTGALRLEDVRGRLLLVQIAVKSMVMDVKVGQRLVDDCVHGTQSENRRQQDKAAGDAAAQAASAAAAAPVQAAVEPPAPSAEQAASAATAAPPPAPPASGADNGAR